MRSLPCTCTCAALILLACGDSGSRDTVTTTSAASAASITVTAPGDTTDTAAPTSSADATDSATDSNSGANTSADPSAGPKFDVGKDTGGVDPDTGEPVAGCQKIDFLFVVDNSGSMSDEQQSLATSFDGFITSIQNTVKAEDYHIMVIDTDAGSSFLQECLVLCAILPECQGYPCNMLPTPEGCDATLGAGLLQNPKGEACGIAGDDRYMVDGQPNLSKTFECVAKVGTNGDGSERPMEAMIAAVSTLNVPGACNEGFLRNDALLVVTFITDEEDDGQSKGSPVGWQAGLVAAKKGAESSIVVLGLIGDTDQPNATCAEGEAEASPRLRTFAESFTFGSWAPICSLDYAPFFDASVSVIDTACKQFEPPG